MSAKTGCEVYLKIETFQTSGSFKGRGVSHFANNATKGYLESREGIKHLFLRHNTGIDGDARIEVNIGGENYFAALKAAEKFSDELGDRGILVPAYDDPLVWQGHSTLIQEISEQLPNGLKPDALLCSVGGAGLIAGLMVGCEVVPTWDQIPIIGVEPNGAACFYHSVLANRSSPPVNTSEQGDSSPLPPSLPAGARIVQEHVGDPFVGLLRGRTQKGEEHKSNEKNYGKVNIVHVGSITSRATSLGASSPAPAAVAMAIERKGLVKVVKITDERAMSASLGFADDHFVVTELACSATLVPAYTPSLLSSILSSTSRHPKAVSVNGYSHTGTNGTANGKGDATPKSKPVVVFIVCGGSKGSVEDLKQFRTLLGEWNDQDDEIWVDGERL
ncbi:hypothetical protein FS842_009105 [Serendipita sp. 407]|nr:hypothetical protein FS842_009105 [Serendipita sp. 407]